MNHPEIDIKKILYATDLSDNSRLAFAYAANLANQYQAGLTILHVIAEDPDLEQRLAGFVGPEKWEEIKQQHFQEAREALIGKQRSGGTAIRKVIGSLCEDVQVKQDKVFRTDEVLIERGDAAQKILDVSEANHIDIIVMGSHGYGTLKDAMMGGTARKVLRQAKMPVLLVRLPEED